MIRERRRSRLIRAVRLASYPAFEAADWRRVQSLILDANNARSTGNYSKAEQQYLTAIGEAEGRPDLTALLHSSRSGLALVYQAQGRYAEAESIYLNQLTEAQDSPLPYTHHTHLHAAYIGLAQLCEDQGRYAQAEEHYNSALAETETPELLSRRWLLISTSVRVAQFYISQQNYAAAEPFFKRTLEILEKEEPRRDTYLPHHLKEFAKFYQVQERHAAAEELYRRAVAVSERCRGPEDAATVQYLYDLGAFYRATGRHAEAEAIYRRALMAVEKTAAIETARYLRPWKRLTLKSRILGGVIRNIESSVGTALSRLAECYEDQQRYAEAEPLRRRSLDILEMGLGKIVPHLLADALEAYADLLRKLGRDAEVEQVEARSRPIRAKHPKGSYRYHQQLTVRPGRISLRRRLSTFINVLLRPSVFPVE